VNASDNEGTGEIKPKTLGAKRVGKIWESDEGKSEPA